MTSPSWTRYSRPSTRSLPAARSASIEPAATSSSTEVTSARMKCFSKSVWILEAATGAHLGLFRELELAKLCLQTRREGDGGSSLVVGQLLDPGGRLTSTREQFLGGVGHIHGGLERHREDAQEHPALVRLQGERAQLLPRV